MSFDFLKCPICDCEFTKIDKQHLRSHGLTLEQYKQQYPDGPFGYSEALKQRKSGKNHPLFGKERSVEDRIKIGIASKKTWETQGPSEKQIQHAREMGMRDGVSVNKGKTHVLNEEAREKISERIKQAARINPKENTHFWYLRNVMCKWALFDEECDTLHFSFTCKTCNNFTTVALSTLHRHSYLQTLCKTCNPIDKTSSIPEKELADFITSLGEIITRNYKYALDKAGEIDIFVLNKNIGFEYHGLYYHSFINLKDTYRHRRKFEVAKDKNIHLVQIFSDEWSYKNDIVKSRIRNILGVQPKQKIFARNTKFFKISYKEAKEFLDKYHMQGCAVKTGKNYALIHNDEIVSVMTFSLPRKPMNHKSVDGVKTLELVRYAVKDDVIVMYGASKLLANVIKEENPDIIQSWADLRWVNPADNLYLTLGFELKSDSKIGYCYTDFNKRYHRYGFRKPKDCPEGMKEGEYWETKGFYQVYDCGQYLYELKLR